MDFLSSVFTWLSDREAGISAVVGIAVLAGIVLAGLRSLVRRRAETSAEKPPADTTEAPPARDSSLPGPDSLTVPGFEGHPAIAVLAFDNLSGDPEQEYFADGIAEDLITLLSAWRDFPVIARNSSFVYKGHAVDVKQVSRELGVRYVVEGSVRKAEDRVRISAQLIDATTGQHVWAERYDRELRDIFALQDEITEAIVAQMYPELMRSEQESVVRSEPKNLDAYDCERRGSWYSARLTKEDNAKARLLYERATELDPYAATAFRGLAIAHYQDQFLQWSESPAESIEQLVQAAQRSVALDDKDSSGQLALGIGYRSTGQLDKAIAAFELAVELNPSLVGAHYHLGMALAFRGSADEAIVNIDKAMRLSPHDWMMWLLLNGVAIAHAVAERYEEALEWANRSVRLKPDWPISHLVLSGCYARLGQVDAARRAVEEVRRLNPTFSLAGIELVFASADPAVRERIVESLRKAGLPE